MPSNNPFESPQSDVTADRAPTLQPAARIARTIALGILGYAVYALAVYLAGRGFGSFEALPRDIWARGIYLAMTFAGSELFVNSRNRPTLRRLMYSMLTMFFSAILGGTLLQFVSPTTFFPHRSQLPENQIRIVFVQALIFGLIFVCCATTLNAWQSRRRAPNAVSDSDA